MGQENICQFYIIVGDKEFRPLNTNDVYINATGVLDNNLIREYVWKKFDEKRGKNINSKIIFLVPSDDFKYRCEEIANALNIKYDVKFVSEYISENEKSQNIDNIKEVEAGEGGLYNSELRIVRNNVSNENKYSTVEESVGQVQVVNPNVSNASINSSGISNNFGGRTEEGVIDENVQTREKLGEYYLDEQYNIYNSDGNIIGRVGQNGVWVDYNTNTLVVNGKLVGYVGDYKDMGKSLESLNKNNVRVKKKEENKSAAFVSLPVIMFILSAMLLVGSIILLFVLE